MTVSNNQNDQLNYEEALEKLEQIVCQLEQGDVPLEQALVVYQQGVELVAYCHKILNKVEEKLTIINVGKGEG